MKVTTRKQRIQRKIIKGIGLSFFRLALGTGGFFTAGNAWRLYILEKMQATINSDEIIQNQKRSEAKEEGKTLNQDAAGEITQQKLSEKI